MPQNIRKWFGLIGAVVSYYLIHEGAHLVVALLFGTFERVRFAYWGLGVQIVADTAAMSAMQIFLFSVAGVLSTLVTGYILVWKAPLLAGVSSKLFRSAAYYTTLVFLLLDPLYLSVVHRFVGGGDMNGITLTGIPVPVASAVFLAIGALNLALFLKKAYPRYKASFSARPSL